LNKKQVFYIILLLNLLKIGLKILADPKWPWQNQVDSLIQGDIINSVMSILKTFFGMQIYTVFILITIFLIYIRTESGIISLIVTTILWSILGFLIVPEVVMHVVILLTLSIAAVLYKIAKR